MAEKVIRTIGVLTSGGDAPGMNAAIRAVVRTALGKGLKVRGIRRGYSGLLNEEIIDLSARDVVARHAEGIRCVMAGLTMQVNIVAADHPRVARYGEVRHHSCL